MSATLGRLRKRAAELEQKKQFDRALEVYVQILDDGGKDLDDEDVPLFNRVGDMLMRKGSVTEALGYYERAVDMYAERGYLNNAIALCSKILRQSPGRAAVYYKLARISAKKGFKSDARKNFLEYADRMQKLGMADEAFRALKEFASLYPDQDDVRLVLAELLSKENRKGEALEQLQSLYDKLKSEGRGAEARATIDRMRAIDPSVTPRPGSPSQTVAAGDLVFLDLSDSELSPHTPREGGVSQPASARAPMPTPVPALTGLSITFFPSEAETPHPEGFESTAVEKAPPEPAPLARALTPAGTEFVIDHVAPLSTSKPDLEAIESFDMIEGDAPPRLRRIEEALESLALEPEAPRQEAHEVAPNQQTPLSGIEFADLHLDDAPHGQTHREHDLTLPGELPVTPDDVAAVVAPSPSPASAAAGDDGRAAAEEAADLAADMAEREAALQPRIPAQEVPAVDEAPGEVEERRAEAAAPPAVESRVEKPAAADSDGIVADDFMAMPPSFGASSDGEEEHAFPPLFGLDEAPLTPEDSASQHDVEPHHAAAVPSPHARIPTPHATISIGSAEAHLRGRLELEPENWDLRRQLGEALLDTGDRDGGLYELEMAMVGFELRGDLSRAQEVVDEILGVSPGSVAYHQKRVEYAVRSRDRGRLTHSYLELADALFRTGAGDKAVAVYSRVLELDHDNERAEFALATLAPDALVRLRGVPARPDRWTDELVAIEGGVAPEATGAVDDSPAPGPRSSGTIDAVEWHAAVQPSPAPPPRVDSLELPDPDWGEGVPARSVEEPPPPVEERLVADDASLGDQPPAAPGNVFADFAPPPDEDRVDDTLDEVVADVAASLPPEEFAVSHDEEPPRSPTPLAVATPFESPRPAPPRHEAPLNGADDFIDLGEWLRQAEPVRSTRMQVEDPKPTGDEQADFQEMLRRFKRGVAENVEAEDYEAHYDLGVAFKEMGLVDEAIAQFQKALRGASHRVRSYEALGQCFVEKKQYPIAAALLQRATEVPGSDDQQLVGVLYLLGFATEHLGRPAEALPYYLRVFAVDIEFRDVAERVAAMGNLTK